MAGYVNPIGLLTEADISRLAKAVCLREVRRGN